VHQVRTEMANVATQMADKRGEPPLDAGADQFRELVRQIGSSARGCATAKFHQSDIALVSRIAGARAVHLTPEFQ
jgi:hypothetical protein